MVGRVGRLAELDAHAGVAAERGGIGGAEDVGHAGGRDEAATVGSDRDVDLGADLEWLEGLEEHPGPREVLEGDPAALAVGEQLDREIHRVSICFSAHSKTLVKQITDRDLEVFRSRTPALPDGPAIDQGRARSGPGASQSGHFCVTTALSQDSQAYATT